MVSVLWNAIRIVIISITFVITEVKKKILGSFSATAPAPSTSFCCRLNTICSKFTTFCCIH